MRKYISIIILFFIVLNLTTTTSYGDSPDKFYVDVKVGSNVSLSNYTTLSSSTGFLLYDKENKNKNNEFLEIPENKILVSGSSNEIDIFDLNNNYITSIPGDGTVIIGSNDIDSIVQVGSNKYRDYITFLIKGSQMSIINHIEIENYLYGVVPKEIPASAPLEALKAQAIVARSFALTGINKHKSEGYNLCDTVDCQVYGAYDNEHPSTNQAVNETRGTKVYYNGVIANTYFHSTSGGYTEDSSKVWSSALPYLVAVEDKFSSNSPNSSWTISMTQREVYDKLLAGGINVGEILDMEILSISEANRVQQLKIKGTNGDTVITGAKLRTLLGSTNLKSTWFNIENTGSSSNSNTKVYVMDGSSMYPSTISLNNAYILDGKSRAQVSRSAVSRAIGSGRTSSFGGGTLTSSPKTFVFNGKGYGHGVGMSQYGAIEMAKLGYNYYDIITHYFKGVEVSNF